MARQGRQQSVRGHTCGCPPDRDLGRLGSQAMHAGQSCGRAPVRRASRVRVRLTPHAPETPMTASVAPVCAVLDQRVLVSPTHTHVQLCKPKPPKGRAGQGRYNGLSPLVRHCCLHFYRALFSILLVLTLLARKPRLTLHSANTLAGTVVCIGSRSCCCCNVVVGPTGRQALGGASCCWPLIGRTAGHLILAQTDCL